MIMDRSVIQGRLAETEEQIANGGTKLRSNAGSSPNLKPMEARLPMPNIC
jgi:hypothetical protein